MSEPWLLQRDGELMDRSRIVLMPNYENTEVQATDLWGSEAVPPYAWFSGRFPPAGKRFLWRMKGGKIEKLKRYGILPGTSTTPLIDDEMRAAVESVCSKDEVFFYPAEVRSKYDEMLMAWCVVPTNILKCVDYEASVIGKWWDKEKTKPWKFSELRFKKNCMNGLNFVRDDDFGYFLLVSDALKEAMEACNPYGIRFVRDHEFREYGSV